MTVVIGINVVKDTIGSILGHSLKGLGIQLTLSTNFDAVTARYADVRNESKRRVLEELITELPWALRNNGIQGKIAEMAAFWQQICA